jgi:hypothetical protein
LAAIAVERGHEFEARLCAAPTEPGVSSLESISLGEAQRETDGGIEAWELHSELVLVCPEVRKLALELLPEPDTAPFVARPREPILLPIGPVDNTQRTTRVPAAVVGYTFWRLLETARIAFFTAGTVVALALLADLLH